jgi:hypothetical protein
MNGKSTGSVGVIFFILLFFAPENARSANPVVSLFGPETNEGGLVGVSAQGLVGVLLDEIPQHDRDRIARQLTRQSVAFWISRARDQMRLMNFRLAFRQSFYSLPRKQLPLPPEKVWRIKLTSKPYRKQIGRHDFVLIRYQFNSVVVAPKRSPGDSEPRLRLVGGRWAEAFVLPVDPELLFQRTRFACVNESEFPPSSVDSEEMASFYDQTCDVQSELSNRACHQTELPAGSCENALKAKVGVSKTLLVFVRLPWNRRVAHQYSVGVVTNPNGPDLQVFKDEFRANRLIYRYIDQKSCTITEKCVGGTGWRRLLQFSTADENTGTKDLDIGHVDYFLEGRENPLQAHHVFEYSACHNHYHFTHYGQFSFGDAIVSKRGFCLQSTNRVANRITSPLSHDYGDCRHQGVAPGWVDEYKAGLECQWIDVTEIDTSRNPVTRNLTFISNPDGFLCEGEYLKDETGNQIWERTNFKTTRGEPVDRPQCSFFPNWFSNNTDFYSVTLPVSGEGYLTTACAHGEIGPLRNCGFEYQGVSSCNAGTVVKETCSSPKEPQVVRICEGSVRLNSGTACKTEDALANVIVDAGETKFSFKCPTAKDSTEPGGLYSSYKGALSFSNTSPEKIVCISKHMAE